MLPQLHCGNFMAREFIGQMKTKFIFIVNSFSWILLPAWTHLPSLLIPAKSIVRSPFPLSRDNLLHHSIPLLWITNAVQRPHTVSYMVPFVHQNNPQRQPPHSLSCFTAMVTLLTPWEFVTNYHSMDHYTLDSACSSLSIKFKLIIISIVSLSSTAFHYPLHWDNTITAPATSSNVQCFDDHLHFFYPKTWCPVSDLNCTPTTTAWWQQKTSRTLNDFQCSMQFTSSDHLPRWLCLFTTALC